MSSIWKTLAGSGLKMTLGATGLTGSIGILWFRKFIQGYWYDRSANIPKNLKGLRIVVTGANSGTGFAFTKICAERGATVFMLCRSRQRCELAMKGIKPNMDGKLFFVEFDTARNEACRQAARELVQQGGNVNVVMLNAGVSKSTNDVSVFQINYLGHWVFLNELMKAGGLATGDIIPRVISVSSGAHTRNGGNIDLENPHNVSNGEYGHSKLAQIMHMRELQRRYPQLLACSVTPGFVRTEIVTKALGATYQTLLYPLFLILGRSPYMGAQVMCHAAFGDSIKPGGYYSNCLEKQASGDANNDELRKKLWLCSEKLAKL